MVSGRDRRRVCRREIGPADADLVHGGSAVRTKRLEWVDGLGDTDVWMDGVAAGKVTDFAGEADAADVAELRDYRPVKRLALVACLVHKARMRVRDDLATMFCKRVATKVKKAKQELEEIRLAEREIVEALIGN
ncbi:hypothetical protein ABVG11_21885 [Streptomyces sp. HD1123-B1]|uniref:hypothetical protein n=1 Tax=Streptomyces huangiella TaxID=3228804 RepID=UPI003D7C8409